jgi:hypothetical protein
MLSNREQRWIVAGGTVALVLLYLWLVLLPLGTYHRRMRQRIGRLWGTVEKLEREIGDYIRVAEPVRVLIRRATEGPEKLKPAEKIRLFVRQTLGKGAATVSYTVTPVWEGSRVALLRCRLKGKTTPGQVFKLVQRFDGAYTPFRVGSWRLEHLRGGIGDLTMEVYYLKAVHP